jgi:hypothetical protein
MIIKKVTARVFFYTHGNEKTTPKRDFFLNGTPKGDLKLFK